MTEMAAQIKMKGEKCEKIINRCSSPLSLETRNDVISSLLFPTQYAIVLFRYFDTRLPYEL